MNTPIILRRFHFMASLAIFVILPSCMMTSKKFDEAIMGKSHSQGALIGAAAVDVVTFPVQAPIVATGKVISAQQDEQKKKDQGEEESISNVKKQRHRGYW